MPRIDALLAELLAKGGTDLHIAPLSPPLMRVKGELVSISETLLPSREVEELLVEILTPSQGAELSEKREIIFGHLFEGHRLRVRYGAVTTGFEAVFRLIPSRVMPLSELGGVSEVLWRMSDRKSGLFIVAGPSGSGKSTSVAAMLDQINKSRGAHVVTIEDPVEQIFEGNRALFSQREIRRDAPDLATAIRGVSRADADLCAISQLAGKDAIIAALDLAATEMAVFACMNSGSVVSTVERIWSAYAESDLPRARNLLADVLAGIVVQRLVPTQDGRGRVMAHETLIATPQAIAALREGKSDKLAALMQAGQGQGMQTLDMSLERLMSGGKIAPEAALASAFDKEAFSRIVARHRPDLAEPPIL